MADTDYLRKIPAWDDRLTMGLTHLDRVQSARDRHWNRYFLGIALRAAEGFGADCATIGPEAAFVDRFTPSREMHRLAKWIGLDLAVDRGQWILPDGARK